MRAVVFRDSGAWVVQGIDFDIGAQAETQREAISRFHCAAKLEQAECDGRGEHMNEAIGPAPQRFHDMWAKANSVTNSDGIIREYAI